MTGDLSEGIAEALRTIAEWFHSESLLGPDQWKLQNDQKTVQCALQRLNASRKRQKKDIDPCQESRQRPGDEEHQEKPGDGIEDSWTATGHFDLAMRGS